METKLKILHHKNPYVKMGVFVLIYLVYSSSNWALYCMEDIEVWMDDPDTKEKILFLQTLILFPMCLIQIFGSAIIEFKNPRNPIIICTIINLVLSFTNAATAYADIILCLCHGLISGLVIPYISKLCSNIFTYNQLNLIFIFFVFSESNAKFLARIFNQYIFDFQASKLLLTINIFTSIIVLLLIFMDVKNPTYKQDETNKREDLNVQPFIDELSICFLFNQYSEYSVAYHLKKHVDPLTTMSLGITDLLCGIGGLMAGALFTIIDYASVYATSIVLLVVLQIHILSYAAYYIVDISGVIDIVWPHSFLWIGIFLKSQEAFLVGSLAIRAGLTRGSVTKSTGFVSGFGYLGQALFKYMLYYRLSPTLIKKLSQTSTVIYTCLICKLLFTARQIVLSKKI